MDKYNFKNNFIKENNNALDIKKILRKVSTIYERKLLFSRGGVY